MVLPSGIPCQHCLPFVVYLDRFVKAWIRLCCCWEWWCCLLVWIPWCYKQEKKERERKGKKKKKKILYQINKIKKKKKKKVLPNLSYPNKLRHFSMVDPFYGYDPFLGFFYLTCIFNYRGVPGHTLVRRFDLLAGKNGVAKAPS
jgi:hypothetical protein